MDRHPSLDIDMALWPPASFEDLPVEMVQWVSDRIKHKQDLLSFCRVCWSLRNIGLRTLRNRMRSIYIEPTAASIAKFRTVVANPAVASRIHTIIYLQTVPLVEPLSFLQRADFEPEARRHQCTVQDRMNVTGRLRDRQSGFSKQTLERCLVEAVEQLPNLQHIVIAASPAAVESDTSGHYSGDVLNADSRWIVKQADSTAVNRKGARASPADKLFEFVLWRDGSRFFLGLAPLLVAMAHHADCRPEVPLNFTFQGYVPVGTKELRDFAKTRSATFEKAMGHIKNFYIRATLSHGVVLDGPVVVSSQGYEKMLSKLANVQGLGILTNVSAVWQADRQADLLGILLDQRFSRLQGVQFQANVAIFDPAIESMQQQLVPLLHTGQQLSDFLFRHRNTLRQLALNCVSGVHKISPQGPEIGTLKRLVLSLRKRQKFGRLERFDIGEIVIFRDRHDDVSLPCAQVLKREVAREASSELGKLARELNAVREGWVRSKTSDGITTMRKYNGPANSTTTTNGTNTGASAATQSSQDDNVDYVAAQVTASQQVGTYSIAVEAVRTPPPNDGIGTEENPRDAIPAVVSETTTAIDSEHDTLRKERFSKQDNADDSAAQAAASEQAEADATAEGKVSTRDSSNDNGTGEDAGPAVVSQHLTFGYEFRLEVVKPDAK